MNISSFIAKTLIRGKQTGSSKVIISIATYAVGISIAVMLVSVAVVKGYQHEIKYKVTGFASHIQLSRLDLNNSYEAISIACDTAMERSIRALPHVVSMSPYVQKAGIIKSDKEFTGVVLKGVDSAYQSNFISQHIIKGRFPNVADTMMSKEVLISKDVARNMQVDTGDFITVFFVQDVRRARRFKISGIYETGFAELDETFAMVDMRVLQRVNNWTSQEITGYEIYLADYAYIDQIEPEIFAILPYYIEIQNIRQIYPQLFEWLSLLDINVWVILVLMVVVACINMTTALLILIVDRSHMIAILKTNGATDAMIRYVFMHIARHLLKRGMLIGNIVGVVFCLVQFYFSIIKLDPQAYYLDHVPIRLLPLDLLWINLGTFFICIAAMLVPTRVVSKILPASILRAN